MRDATTQADRDATAVAHGYTVDTPLLDCDATCAAGLVVLCADLD